MDDDLREWPPRTKAKPSGATSVGRGKKEEGQEEKLATSDNMTTTTTKTRWLKRVHFDEQFCEQMDWRVRRCHNLKHNLEIKNKLTHSLLAHLLIFYSRFCRINIQWGRRIISPFDDDRQDKPHNLGIKSKSNIKSNTKTKREYYSNNNNDDDTSCGCKLFEWPNLITVLYIISTALISMGLYYHYIHDQFVFHLRRFSQAQATGQYILMADYANSNVTREKLARKVNETRPLVNSYGAPFLEATYGSECAYIYMLFVSFANYLNLQIYNRFVRRMDFYAIRLLLNRTDERKNFNRLICEEANKYIQSSCNFTEAFIDRCIQLNGLNRFKLEQLNNGSELRRLLVDYKSTIKSLKRLALEGSLQPMNRTDLWIDWLTELFCWASLAIMTIPSASFGLAFIVVPVRFYNFKFHLEPMDLVAGGGLAVLWTTGVISCALFGSLTIVNCLDQAAMIESLIREIKRCIGDNKQVFEENFMPLEAEKDERHPNNSNNNNNNNNNTMRRKSVGSSWRLNVEETKRTKYTNGLISEMNNRLLFVFVHYKILMAQLRPIQSSLGFTCMTTLFCITLMPLIGRFHLPYVSTNTKLMIIAISLATLAMGSSFITPVCHLHLKCLKLYESLCCLLAHSVDVATSSAKSNVRIYDKHTIWMIRKELNHPDRLANQFATKCLGLSFNYSNLIRINFWFGLIILSILTDVQSDQEEVIGSLTSDPLRVFALNNMDN